MRPGLVLAVGMMCSAGVVALAAAQTGSGRASAETDPPLDVRWSFKSTGVFSRPDQAGLWRVRVEPTMRLGSRASMELAYEHRVRATSGASGMGLAALPVLPAEADPPYRLTPLDWQIAEGRHATWRHEIDRALVRVPFANARLDVGRQAIGWGRGVMFGAVDLFAPFSPFEVDREWRPGVDALHLDVALSSLMAADVVAAFGGRSDEHAYVGRLRGYSGTIDVEAMGGWRARDSFAGAATSFVAGQGEVHAETAVFRTPAVAGSPAFGVERTIVKLVAGGSTRLAMGSGLVVYAEYHYSGFGAPSAADLRTYLTDPAFVERYVRGDMQILTRHAVAAVAAYEWSPIVSATATLIQEPTDGSGVFTPTLTLTFGDHWSLVSSVYLTYGRSSTVPSPASAYGAAPDTLLVQLRVYR